MPTQLENIGLAMQGFGAGIQGNLPQFQQAQTQKKESEMRQQQLMAQQQLVQQEQQRAMMEQVEQSLYNDAQGALNLVNAGRTEDALKLGLSSLQSLQQLGVPPEYMEEARTITRLLAAARNGDEEALELVKGELESTVAIGREIGRLEKPPEDRDLVQVFPAEGSAFTAQTDGQGNYFNMTGAPIEIGAADRVTTSSLTGGMGDLDLSSADLTRVKEAEISALNFSDTVDDMLLMLSETPDINTFIARAASTVNNLQAEAEAMGRSLGVDIDTEVLNPGTYTNTFDTLGIQNQRMRSLVTAAAYQAAAAQGQEGRAISDRDVTRFIEEIGADAADPRAFAATLQDVRARSIRGYQNRYQVTFGEPYRGPLEAKLNPTPVSSGSAVNITEGATATNPQTGERLVFQGGQWVPL